MRKLSLVMLTLIVALSFVACKIDTPSTPGGGVTDAIRPDGTIDVPNPTGELSKEDFDSVNASMEELYQVVPEWTQPRTQMRVYDAEGDRIAACEIAAGSEFTDFEIYKTLEGMSFFTEGIKFRILQSGVPGGAPTIIVFDGRPFDSYSEEEQQAINAEYSELAALVNNTEQNRSVTTSYYNGVATLESGQTITTARTEIVSDGPDGSMSVVSFEFNPFLDGMGKVVVYTHMVEHERRTTLEIVGGQHAGVYDVTDFMNSGQPQG